VKLLWANADQYYTKSGENFTNYDFTVDGKKVHFKLVQAAVAKDNVKDNDCVRCFVLWDPDSAPKVGEDGYDENLPTKILEVKDGELYIYFQYKKLPKGAKQKDFADEAYAAIQKKMTEDGLWDEYPIFKEAPTEADKHRTVLMREFTRYMAKNTSDYFIHKNLRKFLTQELDNYVKTEMMNLDDISNAATFDMIAANLRLIQTFRLIAMELIGFMAQLEDFHKKLWLKKKFVVQCDYCITMDRVPEELRAEVLANKAQLKEWERLGFGEMNLAAKNAKGAKGKQGEFDLGGSPSSATAVDARMVDTKFFDETFKAKLLRSIPDLDERCDGLLIHSENFGALNFRLVYIYIYMRKENGAGGDSPRETIVNGVCALRRGIGIV
jgi:adenine-specific DNA-methyltransferase